MKYLHSVDETLIKVRNDPDNMRSITEFFSKTQVPEHADEVSNTEENGDLTNDFFTILGRKPSKISPHDSITQKRNYRILVKELQPTNNKPKSTLYELKKTLQE